MVVMNFMRHVLKNFLKAFVQPIYRTPYIHGDVSRLNIGKRVKTNDCIFNTVSGEIHVGDDTIFGHRCMVLTGRHEFINGKRKRLQNYVSETPLTGCDVIIGSGCWIASGAILLGPVKVGDHSIVAAGSIVTRDVEPGTTVAGNPAKVIRKH